MNENIASECSLYEILKVRDKVASEKVKHRTENYSFLQNFPKSFFFNNILSSIFEILIKRKGRKDGDQINIRW